MAQSYTASDIEVLSGLKDGDQIITGTYQIIRTIKNETQVIQVFDAEGLGQRIVGFCDTGGQGYTP